MEGDPHSLCYLAPGEKNISKFMSEPTKKIDLIEDADAAGEVAKVYDEWRAKSGRQQMPGILKCFSHRPDFLREVMRFSDTVHFSAGHLDRRTKEAIASWVSWLNRCPY
jgi:alkylhydroperoxidase family enzyme